MWGPGTGFLPCVPCWVLRTVGVAGGCPGGGSSGRCKGRLLSGAHTLQATRPEGG